MLHFDALCSLPALHLLYKIEDDNQKKRSAAVWSWPDGTNMIWHSNCSIRKLKCCFKQTRWIKVRLVIWWGESRLNSTLVSGSLPKSTWCTLWGGVWNFGTFKDLLRTQGIWKTWNGTSKLFECKPWPSIYPENSECTGPGSTWCHQFGTQFSFSENGWLSFDDFRWSFFSTKAIQDILEGRDGIGQSGGQAL